MDLQAKLATALLADHPEEAARVLESLPAGTAAAVLAGAPDHAAAVLKRASPLAAAEIFGCLDRSRACRVVETLDRDAAARLLRRCEPAHAEAVLAELPAHAARPLRALLRFPEGTAGALMDPDVMALPEDLSAGEAIERIRKSPENARYNVYVVDREQRLVGVLNLRELMLAHREALLRTVMRGDVLRLHARAERGRIAAHPGWRDVHSLPVVDDQGTYLGAVRYRTLRALERELQGAALPGESAAGALGELFATGAAGLLEAMSGAAVVRAGGKDTDGS